MTAQKRRIRITLVVDVPDHEAADALGVSLSKVRYLIEDTIVSAARDALRSSMPSTARSIKVPERND